MSSISGFGNTAKSLARNPLGIIALFIVLIYGFASIVVGASDKLERDERYLIVVFMTVFPVIVLSVFGWLVAKHHEKLYAPKDYNTDEAFLKGIKNKKERGSELINLKSQISEGVKAVLNSQEVQENLRKSDNIKENLARTADKITENIKRNSFITIDTREFTGKNTGVYEFPAGAFSTVSELLDQIYFMIEAYVGAFEYGISWAIKNSGGDGIIKCARMITKTPAGIPCPDERTLTEIGIHPGSIIEIIAP